MITIGKPYITIEGDTAFLRAHVSISDDTAKAFVERVEPTNNVTLWLTKKDYPPAVWKDDSFSLWFSVPAEYGEFLCTERSNSFVVALLWYALASGSDICFEAPVSARLYKGITEGLMPEFLRTGVQPVRLIGPVTADPVDCAGKVITGMTCGVDSFYTLVSYLGEDVPENMRITHLTYCHCDSLIPPQFADRDIDKLYAIEESIGSYVADHATKVAADYGLHYFDFTSNLDKDIYRGGLIYMGMYRFLACVLSLEHLFGLYISSSSGHGTGMTANASIFIPTQNYEDLLCSSLQTETFNYIVSDHDTRTHKLEVIADVEDFRKYAAVCFNCGEHAANCGICYGCMKTMIPLDIIGKLDGFGESFDLPEFYKNREQRYKDLILFSKRPEQFSARATVSQIIELTKRYPGEKADLFLKLVDQFGDGPLTEK